MGVKKKKNLQKKNSVLNDNAFRQLSEVVLEIVHSSCAFTYTYILYYCGRVQCPYNIVVIRVRRLC